VGTRPSSKNLTDSIGDENISNVMECFEKTTIKKISYSANVLDWIPIFNITVSLKKNSRFQNVYKNGISAANRYLVMVILRNGCQNVRLGVTVSKKVGKSVIRSRVTRLIKEAYRLNEKKFKTGFDIVFIARGQAAFSKFSDIEASVLRLAKKLDMRVF
jgi:ribonuclease P protein component